MLSAKQLFVSAIPRRNPKTPQDWLHASSIKNIRLFTGNCPGQTQEKQRRHHVSKEKNKTILESDFTPEKRAHLIQSIATTARLNEKGLIHNAARNPKRKFRNVAKEDTPTRNPKQEFRNVAPDTTARNPKQELRNVATVLPEIKHARKYVEKGNEILRTENESKRMSVVMFNDVDIKSEARDNKRLTSNENMHLRAKRPSTPKTTRKRC